MIFLLNQVNGWEWALFNLLFHPSSLAGNQQEDSCLRLAAPIGKSAGGNNLMPAPFFQLTWPLQQLRTLCSESRCHKRVAPFLKESV
eukprot:1742019-Amphidinium_carterae.1